MTVTVPLAQSWKDDRPWHIGDGSKSVRHGAVIGQSRFGRTIYAVTDPHPSESDSEQSLEDDCDPDEDEVNGIISGID